MYKVIQTFLLCALLCGCSQSDRHQQLTREWMKTNGKVKVLSSISMIDDLVKQVSGDHVDTLTLIQGELDPHSYQLVKGDDEKLAFADVIFYNGLGLEHGPSLQEFLKQNPKAVGLGNRVMDADPALLLYYKGQPDPHIWMDISLWSRTVAHIVHTLSSKDPANADIYRQNGDKLVREMLKAHEDVRHTLGAVPSTKRYLVTSHDAFNYFTRAYLAADGENIHLWQERFAAPEGLAPESQISTTDIQAIITHLEKYHIHVIFSESNVSRDSLRKIVEAAKSKGLKVILAEPPLYADAMGAPGSDGDTYIKMIKHNADEIAELLNHNGG